MKSLLLVNTFDFHEEIIESIIVKYRQILNTEENVDIFLYLHHKNHSFEQYITSKYPLVKFSKPKIIDFLIYCTVYDRHYNSLVNDGKHKYIAHEITERLVMNNNVFFLTPLSPQNYIKTDVLPFNESRKIHTKIPIYIVQGNFDSRRRNYDLLTKILETQHEHDFLIKIIGRRGRLPDHLNRYKHRLIVKRNLNFQDYHKEFLDCYCILPLTTRKTQPQYYKNKLTSTMNYASGYGLKCLIDKDLQNIYNLDNVEVYEDENDIGVKFKKTLDDFYKKYKTIKFPDSETSELNDPSVV